jgi:hypothetical protein
MPVKMPQKTSGLQHLRTGQKVVQEQQMLKQWYHGKSDLSTDEGSWLSSVTVT